jgi:aminoglycoside phosphotransferase (APT) family kinase protein
VKARRSIEDQLTQITTADGRYRTVGPRLLAWLKLNVPELAEPITIAQIDGGQSNPTYKVQSASGAYALRRKPMGKLLPSAHAIDREYKVMAALHGTGFPVPRPIAFCADEEVIGSTFYVMEWIDGAHHWDGTLPQVSASERRALYRAEVSTLARLHMIDPETIGLSTFGKPGNYFTRQIDRWSKQYRASETRRIDPMERLIRWLPATVPPQERVSIVHGDYRLDNLIFSRNDTQIAAVLDWELSTLGDPLADFTYFLSHWVIPPDGRSGLAGLDLEALGIPGIEEMVALYTEQTNRRSTSDLNWYLAYNLYRIVCIGQGVIGRVRDGTAAHPRAAEMESRIEPLAQTAWSFAERAGA